MNKFKANDVCIVWKLTGRFGNCYHGGDYKLGDMFKVRDIFSSRCYSGTIKKQCGDIHSSWSVHPDELILFGEKFEFKTDNEVDIPF